MPTIHELVATARRELYDAGIPQGEADLDARLLIERLLGWDAARYFAHGDQAAPADLVDRYQQQIARRVCREPVAYISGVQEFWGLPIEVTPAVLIPRPETELIVDIALELAPDAGAALQMADVCTGSGCLAVALAVERPAAAIIATDISPDALAVAARNLARHQVSDRVRLVRTDLLEGVDGPFDFIVANPPYVPDGDEFLLQPEVVQREPHLALFAASDGLSAIRPLVVQAVSRLRMGGYLVFEFGYGQSESIAAVIARTEGLSLVDIRNDLQGIPRTAITRRSEA